LDMWGGGGLRMLEPSKREAIKLLTSQIHILKVSDSRVGTVASLCYGSRLCKNAQTFVVWIQTAFEVLLPYSCQKGSGKFEMRDSILEVEILN
jgi:hypothetical protein